MLHKEKLMGGGKSYTPITDPVMKVTCTVLGLNKTPTLTVTLPAKCFVGKTSCTLLAGGVFINNTLVVNTAIKDMKLTYSAGNYVGNFADVAKSYDFEVMINSLKWASPACVDATEQEATAWSGMYYPDLASTCVAQ